MKTTTTMTGMKMAEPRSNALTSATPTVDVGVITGNNNSSDKKNVGILAMEFYTPNTFIQQAALEQHYGVAAGKYTIGLGQHGLAVTGDAEDINSICLTAVHSLLEKYDIDPSQVGRVEVGTETLVDKSKSTKTVLMSLFPGNTDMEGATVVNACYGGTAALFNAFLWCESDWWDGRYAIVVAADIATYAAGPARPTCGVGAVAILIGRDAPLTFDGQTRTTHASHVWDFFKPDPSVEYPTVDGALSQVCYYQALEDVYGRFVDKIERVTGEPFDCEKGDYFVFHAPYNKLVQKSYARLYLLDARRRYADSKEEEKKDSIEDEIRSSVSPMLQEWLCKPIDETYGDKVLDDTLKRLASGSYEQRLSDAHWSSQMIGNTYTASIFFGLASLLDRVGGRGDLTEGKSLILFSYGSGALASMYRLQVREPTLQNKFSIDMMARTLDLKRRLSQREEIRPHELDLALDTRAQMHHGGAPYEPMYPTVGRLLAGTYYLTGIDNRWRRSYARVPNDALMSGVGSPLAPEEIATCLGDKGEATTKDSTLAFAKRESYVVTGTAAGLPGLKDVFQSNNLDRLLEGEQLITSLPKSVKAAMCEKNIIQVKKLPGGEMKRIPLQGESDMIQLAAQLGHLNLTQSYGVPVSLAKTMDVAVQLAVAAGLEALKNAGLVSGRTNDASEWTLPEQYRDTTGVIYCSSFPAMDAAVGEVIRFLQPQTVGAADSMRLLSTLRARMTDSSADKTLSEQDASAFAHLEQLIQRSSEQRPTKPYEFDRKFLFRVLVLGNAQLAQLAGCRGPNTQTNAACAGTTQAMAMAEDMLRTGRAERVVVVAGDNASGESLMPWLGSGFRILGAATTAAAIDDAALPFDKRRTGMLLGAGGTGIVLETESSAIARKSCNLNPFDIKARLVATQYSNSAYHGAALDRKHIGSEFKRFLDKVESEYGITKVDIAENGVYFSHETSTHASDAASCSGNETAALRFAFGEDLYPKLLICNTKGYTGHPMGVSFEDVAAVEALVKQVVPPVSNYKIKDEYLGNLNISKGGPYKCRFALRFAAGFGSQVAFALYAAAVELNHS